jgi:hypothetical protein
MRRLVAHISLSEPSAVYEYVISDKLLWSQRRGPAPPILGRMAEAAKSTGAACSLSALHWGSQ